MDDPTDGPMELEDAAAELYGLTPAEFMPRRTELVKQARAGGDTAAAKAIGELRKPTVSAWLVNQLVRDDDGAAAIEALGPLGDQLRAAQEQLDAPQLKELGRERQSAVAGLVKQAAALSEGKLSAAVQRELEETFTAAVADEQAALAVASGRLTRALAYSGFGDVDVTAATATPIRSAPSARSASPRRPVKQSRRPEPDPDEAEQDDEATEEEERRQRQADRLRAADEAQQAADDLAAAQSDLSQAQQRWDDARDEESRLGARLDELQAEILDTRHQLDAAGRTIAAAAREHSRRERQVKEADQAARRAAQALDDLGSG